MPVLPLVPVPAQWRAMPAPPFRLAGAVISGDADAADELARVIRLRTGADAAVGAEGSIRLSVSGDGAAESYRITVSAEGATVTGADPAGLFYGVQTLAQVIAWDDGEWTLPAVEIEDAPRFPYRGMMLDVARHFFGVADVCAVIDRAAALKCNHLHLHLSDDQGWRLQLRSRPELTARAAQTAVGGDGGGFFTREDYTAIIAHAAARHMTVVPEFDVPGHTHAVGLAYPGIAATPVIGDEVRAVADAHGGGLPTPGEAYTGIAVGFSSLRVSEEATYEFLADVFGELAALTPGRYLHLGGDEAHGTDPADYAAFVARAVDIVAATGKIPIAWHEAAAAGDLPCDFVAQYWGMASEGGDHAHAIARATSVILSPADTAYLDMKPEAGFPLGLEWANGPTSLRRAYTWEPADVVPDLDDDDILGVEAPLWTETVRTLADIDALAFPRLAGLAEIAWSPPPGASAHRTWDSFAARVGGLAPLWTAMGIGFTPAPDVAWSPA